MTVEEATYIAEQSAGKCAFLAHKPIDPKALDEVVLRIQGFIIDLNLPPLRKYHIPRNSSRLIDLKQSVTLTGLGVQGFDAAVRGIQNIYQVFANHISKSGGRLREWVPGRDQQDLTLTFASRYLTSSRDAGEEPLADLAEFVDPFNVLRPLLRGEVHTVDNVVEYWELYATSANDQRLSFDYDAVKPFMFALTSLVEVQVSFMIVRVARQEYAFIPKLRAICLFNRMDYNLSTIRILASGRLSPLKKVKRKIGYGSASSSDSGGDGGDKTPSKAMKRLCLLENNKADVEMRGTN
ncbi:hypothetical protein LXA43DRAFT_897369 [Ganoderma leucocontextum]|nr:hypothetical protein LXA43DRAFT_897369 [Ganoderma leucocontextum]